MKIENKKQFWIVAVLVSAIAAAGLTALLVNIIERKHEAENPFYRVVELNEQTDDPATWGKNFPIQYDDYKKTVDQVRTRFGGSEALPHTPTPDDPRSVVTRVQKSTKTHVSRRCGQVTHFQKIFVKNVGMLICWKIKLSPNDKKPWRNQERA